MIREGEAMPGDDEQLPRQKTCTDCGGTGTTEWTNHHGDLVKRRCSGCMGSGTVLA
ncbi:hypothetical protein ABT160_18650 [Streptomyces sp. NPDC001941]|uniref:hypothetical protein n=1 Tax=Streptomyces sp. NPDC001941 TaxID=3154659 RepID=UPI00332B5B7B